MAAVVAGAVASTVAVNGSDDGVQSPPHLYNELEGEEASSRHGGIVPIW